MYRNTAILVLMVLLIGVFLPVKANKIEDLQQALERISQEMQQTQEALKQLERNRENILDEKEYIERQIELTQQELEQINALLIQSEKNIAQTQRQLEEAQAQADTQYDLLKQRMRLLYEEGNTTYLEIILTSSTLSEFLSRYEIVKEIIAFDNALFDSRVENKHNIAEAKEMLEEELAVQQQIKETVQEKKATLNAQNNSRNAMLNQLSAQQRDYEKALDELEETSEETKKEIHRLQELNRRRYAGGKMAWTTPDYYNITSPYGMRVHPITGGQRMHTGIDIGASHNASVVAANDGVVIFAGWNGGYGLCIIIDHGGGIATLYAHNDRFLVRVDQEVKRGQEIAKVGTTGLSTGPHLHFEVIEKGQHVNPMKYYNE